MVFDLDVLLGQPLSDAGCLCCGKPMHDDDASIHTNPSRFDIAALVCAACAAGKVAGNLVLFPSE